MKSPFAKAAGLVALVLIGGNDALAAFSPPAQLVVVSDDAYPPYLFRAESGYLQGIIVDKWALWSRKTGIPVSVVGMEWIKAQDSLKDGSADVIDALAYTERRTKIYEFSPPYADVEARVFFHRSISGINDVASMRGFTIGAKDGSACAAWLEERGIRTFRRFPTSDAVIEAARTREIPLFCMDLTVAQYFIFKLNLADEFRQTEPLYAAKFHWAVAKGRADLRDFIQSGFERVSPGELRDIETRWIGHPLRFPIDSRYFYYFATVAVGLLAAATLLFGWNRALSQRVSAKVRELKESEERFGQVFRLAPDATVVTSVADGRVIEANEAFFQLMGRAREDVIGRTTEEIGLWRDAQERAARLGPALRPGGVHQYERTIRTPAGVQKDVLVRAARIEMQGEPVLLAMMQDVTEQRLAVRLLEESERRLAKMIEASPEAITIARVEDGTFISVNPAGERLSGYTRDEMIGRSSLEMGFWPNPEDRQRFVADLQRQEGGVHGREIRLRRKDGEVRDVLASAAMIDFEGRKLLLFQGIDITERKNDEKALQQNQELLRELSAHHDSVREGERARIAREIHDEMGQALTALRMDLSVLGLESKAAPRTAGQVQDLKARVDGLIQVVRNVVTTLRPAALDLGILPGIEWLVEEFQKRNGIRCRVNVEDGEIDMAEDRGIVLFRILQESLTNISRHAGARSVEIALRRDATHIRLDVKDDGRGFDIEAAGKKKTFGLLGIRERVIMLHGKVSITSVPGEGTQVSVSIPV